MPDFHSGADAIAAGVLESRVSLVTGYPGSPATSVVDAVQMGAQMLVLVLDNNTTALSGGQPHPGTRGRSNLLVSHTIEIKELAEHSGAAFVQVVEIGSGDKIRSAITRGIDTQGVSVVIARGDCPGCPSLK